MKDSEIVDLYLSRDEAAISASQRRYGGYCYSIAYGILNKREIAEECLNDTWLRAWNTIPPQKPEKLGLFLGKIIRNLSFDRYKAGKAQKRGEGELSLILDELAECVSSPESVEQSILNKELSRAISDFLLTLPVRECNIFLLRYWYSKSLREIDDCFAVKENVIKTSLFRSRKKLKGFLEKEGVML